MICQGGSICSSLARICRMIGNTKGLYLPERSIGRAVKWLAKDMAESSARARHNRGQRSSDRLAIDHPARKPTGLSVRWISGQRVRGKGGEVERG